MLRVGDKVRRVFDVGAGRSVADMDGTVVRVRPVRHAGGVRARVRVRWASGSEATHDDRQLAKVRP